MTRMPRRLSHPLAFVATAAILWGCATSPQKSNTSSAPQPERIAPPVDGPIRLLVRVDDLGALRAINEGAIEASTKGIARSAEVIATGPWFTHAVRALQEHPEIDVGIHLALTSEWSDVKWGPLTGAPSLINNEGSFRELVWDNAAFPRASALKSSGWTLSEIEAEVRAQIEQVRRKLPRLSHATAHMAFSSMDPSVENAVDAILKEYGLLRDTNTLKRFALKWPEGRARNTLSPDERAGVLAEALKALDSGDYLLVTHPGTQDPEMQALTMDPNERGQVARARAAETATLKHPDVMRVIKARNIELISYADLPIVY